MNRELFEESGKYRRSVRQDKNREESERPAEFYYDVDNIVDPDTTMDDIRGR